jgi:glycosyltransferase involved in cell wall biosynthesis
MTVKVWNVCVQHSPRQGGLHRAIEDFARAIDGRVISFEPGSRPITRDDSAAFVETVLCGNAPMLRDARLMSPSTRRDAEAVVDGFELLIAHSLFRGHAPWAAETARRCGRPHWTVPHGCLDPWGMSRHAMAKRAWLRIYGAKVFEKARFVIYSSRREQQKAARWASARNATVVHWPTCAPPANLTELRHRFRVQHGIPPDARMLLFLGRLHSMKRVAETVTSFCIASPSNCHLVIAGPDGDIRAEEIAASIPPAWSDRIHVVGPLGGENLDGARSAADGFISLSHRENFGYSAADSLAWRLPVILSDGHDLVHELPKDSSGSLACGWLIPEDYAGPAVEAIRAFATAPKRRLDAMAHAGAQWAQEHLSFDTFRLGLANLLANS